jgi:streptogramin lyase
MRRLLLALSLVVLALPVGAEVTWRIYPLPRGGGSPHDVAVSADGVVWYTAQRDG